MVPVGVAPPLRCATSEIDAPVVPRRTESDAVEDRAGSPVTGGRQPVNGRYVRTQSLVGIVPAISCPLSWGRPLEVAVASGARIRPFHATPWVTARPAAFGRFHASR